MIETRTFKKDEIICLSGDPGDCMFCIQNGKAGVFNDYGKPEEKRLAILSHGALFGEMSLLDHEPRSATVVSLMDNTKLEVISEENFKEFFENSPEMLQGLARQMANRLRQTTRDYAEACRTVYDAVEVEKNSGKKSDSLMERIKKLCAVHLGSQADQA